MNIPVLNLARSSIEIGPSVIEITPASIDISPSVIEITPAFIDISPTCIETKPGPNWNQRAAPELLKLLPLISPSVEKYMKTENAL